MTDHTDDLIEQQALPGAVKGQHELSKLLLEAQHYKHSEKYLEMLQFVARVRGIGPYNAMLLQLQKPGIRFAASRRDWWGRFRRVPKEGARPLLILQPFGPVRPVYDLLDTEGEDVPESAYCFSASGTVGEGWLEAVRQRLESRLITWVELDSGDGHAGRIRGLPPNEEGKRHYTMFINRNHNSAVQFTTVAHELAHLFLGHLGPDKLLGIARRHQEMAHAQLELEAESVAFIACNRNGVRASSAEYLAGYVSENTELADIDIHRVMLAATHVTSLVRAP